ncbi:MAG TPA: GNAT family N-acetyltransferase [Kribbellaceae bacterium]|nr:GNAT family N-acetyltransferase [Kribbellaceae bacterium]
MRDRPPDRRSLGRARRRRGAAGAGPGRVRHAGLGVPVADQPGPEAFFNERSRPQHVLVAEYESRLVGYLRLKDKYPFTEGAGVLGVFGLGVAPDARRLGVASALLEEALAAPPQGRA